MDGNPDETEKRTAMVITSIAIILLMAGLVLETESDVAEASGLSARLSYYTTLAGFESWGREGHIHVNGWVFNNDTRDHNATLHLWMTDGTKGGFAHGSTQSEFWQSYYFPLGVIPGNGGKKWFEFKVRYNPFDPTTANFAYWLYPEEGVRGAPWPWDFEPIEQRN
jgi:hypothetical protein